MAYVVPNHQVFNQTTDFVDVGTLRRNTFLPREFRWKMDVCFNGQFNLDRTLAQIRPTYTSDVTCQGRVPEAIIAFLESDSYEDAVRKAISLGGDADTQACIAGESLRPSTAVFLSRSKNKFFQCFRQT